MMFTTLSTAYPHVQSTPRLVTELLFPFLFSHLRFCFAAFTSRKISLQTFKDHMIDGETLPLLSEEHLLDTMGLKLGPALKIRSQVRNMDLFSSF